MYTKLCNKINLLSAATARSCDFEEVAENQGLWDFKTDFLYQIYTRKLRILGCDMETVSSFV